MRRSCPGDHDEVKGAELIDKVVAVDQQPIGRTPRSNPATYTGVFDKIRRLFAETPEAKIRGYQPGRFSFNVKGGRCEACAGDGTIKIEMHFLPDVYVACEVCDGARYNRETLEVLFRGRSIADVLAMPADEALDVLRAPAAIARHIQTLVDVGLGYVRLGQPAPDVLGWRGPAREARHRARRRPDGHTLYVLDEPTTGLHFEDVRRLLEVLQRLVEQGNTVVVIEHNLDVVKSADWLVDLGPEGGAGGGSRSGRARGRARGRLRRASDAGALTRVGEVSSRQASSACPSRRCGARRAARRSGQGADGQGHRKSDRRHQATTRSPSRRQGDQTQTCHVVAPRRPSRRRTSPRAARTSAALGTPHGRAR